MNTITFVIIYFSIAAAVTAHVFYHGVLHRPRVSVFSLADQTILAITSVGVGTLWVLFVPAIAVLVAQRMVHLARSRVGTWTPHRPQHARARS